MKHHLANSRITYYILLISLAGFALRLYRLGADSLWYDETVSAYLAAQPVVDLIAHTARDIHPPGYYLLLHFWAAAAGHSEFALAFFSLIFGVLLIALTYRLARLLTTPRAAAWAALLVAASPYHLWYSQEVRMYTLGAALGVAATYCALRALHHDQFHRRFWLGYVVCAALGLYTLYYFAFLLVILNLVFLASLLKNIKNLRQSLHFDHKESKVQVSASTPALQQDANVCVPLLTANALVIATYLPWLPIAWRQITNPPVPPWRSAVSLWSMLLESWSALSLGQSVDPAAVWPILLLTLVLFMLGLRWLYSPCRPTINRRADSTKPAEAGCQRMINSRLLPATLLLGYTFGPLLLIYLLSSITYLYHVRYIFTYAPAFYIILAVGLDAFPFFTPSKLRPDHRYVTLSAAKSPQSFTLLSKIQGILRFAQNDITQITLIGLLLAASAFSIYRFHTDPHYRPDDYRAAVAFITNRWQPGDVILVNAGYTYTAFVYYNNLSDLERRRLVPYQPPIPSVTTPYLRQTGTLDGPSTLGWGDPRADFYAMPAAETISALNNLSGDFYRLWQLRAYDTVTDPQGVIRTWLHKNTIPLEDELFAGESNIRAQGFLLNKKVELAGERVNFEDGLALTGWTLPPGPWRPGQTVYVKLTWLATVPPHADYKISLKLWAENGQLAAQGRDEWPGGTLYRATKWLVGQTVYQPVNLTLPTNLPPGRYWLNVELYHPDTVQPLPRLDGQTPVVTLGPVMVE